MRESVNDCATPLRPPSEGTYVSNFREEEKKLVVLNKNSREREEGNGNMTHICRTEILTWYTELRKIY